MKDYFLNKKIKKSAFFYYLLLHNTHIPICNPVEGCGILPLYYILIWCNTLGLKNEKSFQRIVLHHCSFECIKILTNNILSLV